MKATINYDRETFADEMISWRMDNFDPNNPTPLNLIEQQDLVEFIKHKFGEGITIVDLDIFSHDDYITIKLLGFKPPHAWVYCPGRYGKGV